MARVDPEHLSSLQAHTAKIRNFCILAHVDHGKTTLSDSLISSNGIFSPRLAGKLRFLDSTEEEQKRGITMHSSAISLLFKLEKPVSAAAPPPSPPEGTSTPAAEESDEYLINLVDSPGHIDFSSDVSTATRLCDGALIVVDVLEGLCTQTHAVLYKALKERMRPCLVLNKLDRLALEMRLSPIEAFHHLRRIVENANALAYSLVVSELRSASEAEERASNGASRISAEAELDSPLLTEWTFSPDKGNVIFASALDCWGFGTVRFANLWSKKLQVNKAVLQKYLFEDYSFNPQTKKIVSCDPHDPLSRPMFATMVLEPIWALYDAAVTQQDPEKAAKMASRVGVDLPPREVNKREPRATAQAIFRKWLPLADSILRMIVRCVPSPVDAQATRLMTLLQPAVYASTAGSLVTAYGNKESTLPSSDDAHISSTYLSNKSTSTIAARLERITSNIACCATGLTDSTEVDVVVFIAKMMPCRVGDLASHDIALLNRRRTEQHALHAAENGPDALPPAPLDINDEVFLALGRVFSGELKRSSRLFVLGHRHDPNAGPETEQGAEDALGEWGELHSGDGVKKVGVDDVKNSAADLQVDPDGAAPAHLKSLQLVPVDSFGMYILFGPSVRPVDSVPAGNIVGIVGLSDLILKTGTLCSTWCCAPLRAITFQAQPMVRVAVEPLDHKDLPAIESGLQALYQYDPVVEVGVDENGQHTMNCLGELHLEQCLKTLSERFAKCQVKASEPLVSYKETVLYPEPGLGQRVLPPPWCDLPNLTLAQNGTIRVVGNQGSIAITLRCFPLPETLTRFLDSGGGGGTGSSNTIPSTLNIILAGRVGGAESAQYIEKLRSVILLLMETPEESTDGKHVDVAVQALSTSLGSASSNSGPLLGCSRNGGNLLVMGAECSLQIHDTVPGVGEMGSGPLVVMRAYSVGGEVAPTFTHVWSRLSGAITAGFQMASSAGPLMLEPMYGVGFAIECVEVASSFPGLRAVADLPTSAAAKGESPQLQSGQLISECLEAFRLAFLSCPVRIVEPIFSCNLQCDQGQLGNLYAVLSRRRGDVIKEDIIDGTTLFLLSATIPVAESFGFAQELLKKTSGNATAPQMLFSHWQIQGTDPFWRASTQEELEDHGDTSLLASHNSARVCIDAVRKRKGQVIEEKVVASAEKQRNMNKKK